ncbi:putative defensin-like protein 202 [Arabidopsis thaliana]|uniref:Putative defensin-like protein 202 n=3 Tax=Arabidopsis TaxID=3701 RepID=DF202_ARATH|nr:Defensin-like (DEFL) family protein [Arabidopsis thaliana]Q2V3J6.1 RecName: Full=Putative defensin-like protein 202; Flags: Precursor [Arabidopsis thaliana]KAG7615593.1 hypothetical protein ISN45_At04g011480 [Arabidopsis thaliana x Arabidopsis arenosa]AEE83007.1 Defensin-like (DEFL) family protein [Arabidopsis thaliana]OAO97571.1 hypothetical protein AXX17_AT4G12880 [Arabidopsis thaliana]VYS62308.1 unnamed protein product [Arabidopsis thaliana]|eukprot:NP_001031618.1 Defensin-like (DEFL) family protein [Arabidopsis thaliana]
MAKTQNFVCFTAVLLILILVSTEIPMIEGKTCKLFRGECPVDPCEPEKCDECCKATFGKQICGKCEQESTELHCHCRR